MILSQLSHIVGVFKLKSELLKASNYAGVLGFI